MLVMKITYTFTTYNCGDITLGSGYYIFDPMLKTDGYIYTGHLVPGATEVVEFTHLLTENDCGELVNDAWAIGYPNDGAPVQRSDSSWTVNVNCEPPAQPGTATPGYWKNHPDAWPVDQV